MSATSHRPALDRDGRVDVAVIGSGPAGAATALTLARTGARVLVVDRSDASPPAVGESLPPHAGHILRDLGVWGRFLGDNHLPVHGNRSIWGTPEPEEIDFLRHPDGRGWRLDRRRFDAMLADAAEEAGAVRSDGTRVVRCRRVAGGGWDLDLAAGYHRISAHAGVVVDASGRARLLGRAMGMPCEAHDRLVGVVGLLAPRVPSRDGDSLTLIEAVREGWWYAGLLPDGNLIAGYMTDADLVVGDRARTAEGWTGLLMRTQEIRARVAEHGYRLTGAPRLVCADSSRLRAAGGDGWCAVGDAVAAHDPLSSCGMSAALATGVEAARAILASGDLRQGEGALEGYDGRVRDAYARYLAHQVAYYALEQRWSTSPFWRRRHVVLEDLAVSIDRLPRADNARLARGSLAGKSPGW